MWTTGFKLQAVPLLLLCVLPVGAIEYRTFDGAGNNAANPEWGTPGQAFLRRGAHRPRYQEDGHTIASELPNPRSISNALNGHPRKLGHRGLSDFHMFWGIFLIFDITLTPSNASDPLPYSVPRCDKFYDFDCRGDVTINFKRTKRTVINGVREQTTGTSSLLDGSSVYGSHAQRAGVLRSRQDGKLLIGSDRELPLNEQRVKMRGDPANQLRLCGDERGNLLPTITAINTLLLREHNRRCDVLRGQHPDWDDEKLYQEARRRVVAHLQHITYREYLPALLGQPLPLYAGYNASVNPGMDNFFATVTGRYAHPEATMLVLRLDDKWSEIAEGHLRARDVLFNPRVGLAAGSDALLRGMMLKPIAEVRPRYHADLRRNLGAKPYAGARGQDLLATDIWRGRDHGLPTYNEARALYGLPRKASFAEITSDAATRRGLEAAYASVDDVDGIVGALAEDPSRGSVGELLVASLVDQFQRLRDGDRLWYENAQFGAAELREIQTTRLADLVQRNSDIDPPYPNVFYTPDSQLDGGLFPVPEVRDLALEAEFERSQLLDKNFRLLWTVDYANQQVHFAVLARARGLVGLGFSPYPDGKAGQTAMYHADIMIGRMVNGTPDVDDYFSFELGIPSLDADLGCARDLAATSFASHSDGTRVMRFSRAFETADSAAARGRLRDGADAVKRAETVACDVAFREGQTLLVLFAVNPVLDELAYHGASRGTVKLVLVPPAPSQTMLYVLIAVASALALVLALAGWWLWWATAELRALRKKYSNINTAQACAEAIAVFDLEEVEWLHSVPNPSLIQQAFIRIIRLLTEVRPFIPDQVLTRLMAGAYTSGVDDLDEPSDGDSDAPLPKSNTAVLHPNRLASVTSDTEAGARSAGSPPFAAVTTPCPEPAPPTTPPQNCERNPLRPSADSPGRRPSVPAGPGLFRSKGSERRLRRGSSVASNMSRATDRQPDAVRLRTHSGIKRCTYMFIRFRVAAKTTDFNHAEQTNFASRLLPIGKKHKATIDHVTADTVALHWGVSSKMADGAMHAVHTGLDILKLRDALPPEVKDALHLRIGIGHGVCTLVTLNAAGHSFMLTGGAEVALALDLVHADAGAPVRCPLLMTPSLYSKVQFQVSCFPRTYFHDLLLWEPVEVRSAVDADEWMYELEGMRKNEGGWNGQALLGVLAAARKGDAEGVQKKVAGIRQQHAGALSEKDLATLEHATALVKEP